MNILPQEKLPDVPDMSFKRSLALQFDSKSHKASLIGSTDTRLCPSSERTEQEPNAVGPVSQTSSLFKNAQWSPEGTSIIASRANNSVECYILPHDLLTGVKPHALTPYAKHEFPSPLHATAIYPGFELSDPSTSLYLASSASMPIRLLSPFASGILASYPLIKTTTEAYIAPHSLLFAGRGRNTDSFFAGSDCQISTFNFSRDGDGPIEELKTIPSRRKKIVGGGVGMKGIVSAMDMSCEGILAAGTFTRWIGLYDGEGRGASVGIFQLGQDPDDPPGVSEGKGITQVTWSKCGRYLCTAERSSDGIGIWDIRGTGKRLAWLSGRNAMSMQRLSFGVANDEIWAGGIDGRVRVWEKLGKKEGVIGCDWEFQAHDDAVSSAAIHPCGSILASCSGQWHLENIEDDATTIHSESESDEDESSRENSEQARTPKASATIDNNLNIWSFQ